LALQVQECFFQSIFVNSSNELLTSARGSGGVLYAPPARSGAETRKPRHFSVLLSLKSFKSG